MTVIGVRGIGWVTGGEFGGIVRADRSRFTRPGALEELGQAGVFQHPVRNFGRLDRASRMTAAAVGLALRDAGIVCAPGAKQDMGIIGTNAGGSLAADRAYFEDYVQCGRTLGRGNLFIYTLPSSPLGEAAIHFGLLGPLLYLTAADAPLAAAIEAAGDMVRAGDSTAMLAGTADEHEALYVVLAAGSAGEPPAALELPVAQEIAQRGLAVAGMADAFYAVKGRT